MSLIDNMSHLRLIICIAALSLSPVQTIRAEVRSLTLGINVNCPPGLGECWGVGIGEGVAKMAAIDSVSEVADGVTQTAVVRTKEGRLVDLTALAQHIVGIQLGATLRSAEATVDGMLERRDGEVLLKVSQTGETLLLAPLTVKTQWDRRAGREFPATEAERTAFEELVNRWPVARQAVRIIGPLRSGRQGREMILEVREAYLFSERAPRFESFQLGIRVSSPYGLGEPWAAARAALLQCPDIRSVAELPDSIHSVARVQSKDGRIPDLKSIGTELDKIGVGAEVRGVEVTIEGVLVQGDGQLSVRVDGGDRQIWLAPLTHKVQWELRSQRDAVASAGEQTAYRTLGSRPGVVGERIRVTGPVVRTSEGWTLLEVREFESNPPSAELMAAGRHYDKAAPVLPGSPRAILRSKGEVFLDWENSIEEDLAGYHVYRSSKLGGRYSRITRKPLQESEIMLKPRTSPGKYFYAITAIDQSGNESVRSPAIDARAPAAPRHLFGRAGNNAVSLEWEHPETADVDTYIVHRSERPGGPFAAIAVGITECSYVDHGAENGRTFFYTVIAVDSSSNQSTVSNEISLTPTGRAQRTASGAVNNVAAR